MPSQSIPSMTEADITRMVDARVQAAVNQIGHRRPDVKTHLFDYTIQTLLDADKDDLVPLPDHSTTTYDRFETHAFQIYTVETLPKLSTAMPTVIVEEFTNLTLLSIVNNTLPSLDVLLLHLTLLPALVSPTSVVTCVMVLTCSVNVPTLRKPNFFWKCGKLHLNTITLILSS
ncbi:hypothetical protein BC829DRAFT_422413 [Chytridium lagenaria]|nr:hypothetical protein BC829DRAFT_422413 [Chytridium lagenaria]